MNPYGNIPTPDFVAGAPGAAFVSAFLLPLYTVQGPGNFAGALNIFEAPVIQAAAVPNAWNGIIAGQIVSQPLTDSTGLST